MQTDVIRVPGLSSDLNQQITKFDSSEFDDDKEVIGTDAEGKNILSDEGKMYGRNELIARYIKLRTGKTRTRKQVSSHIQVLARRKVREIQAKLKVPGNGSTASYIDQAHKEKALQSMQQMSSAQIVSATAMQAKSLAIPPGVGIHHTPVSYAGSFWQPGLHSGSTQDIKPFANSSFGITDKPGAPSGIISAQTSSTPPWQGRSIGTQKLRLLEFTSYVESQANEPETYHKHHFVHIGSVVSSSDPVLEPIDVRQIQDKFPEKKGGLKELYEKEEAGAFYGVTTTYESNDNMTIQCSTKVCSFGKQVVEKLETEVGKFENGRFLYKIHRSPMCEYMINFIHKLKHLPEKYMMNSVLENFTILQVITNRDTQETLLCVAYVFEVSTSDHGAQHHIYRLVKD
ncbi:TEAD [Lepeophtheirus salmonis]|uniref:TEAD n=1 Tax=Lepeophtheirus salmonis TaxID=72036 RepID=A0A7R8CWX6_LEPSM|nr:TEAD [Lepeophtheirus salmonis]CAF2955957.1 TEAD [Lepeophtheirus salmonis]